MTTNTLTLLGFIAALQFKHFVADGPLQTLGMVRDKSVYGRLWGLIHAGLHGLGTVFVLVAFGFGAYWLVALADAIVHYHIDFAKENFVKRQRLGYADAPFWWAISADQMLHQFTYLVIAGYLSVR